LSSVRPVVRVVHGRPASDGAGVRLTRVIGSPSLPDLDPFLLLDEIRSDAKSDYLGGFPTTRTAGSRPSRTSSPAACGTATTRGTAVSCARGACSG
jgi:hypothetical protein